MTDGGIIPSEEFNEQLKKYVRENMRREHSGNRTKGRWHKKGSGSGGGCNSCCTSIRTGNMIHPDLTAGYDETTRDWTFNSLCGDGIDPIEIPNAAGTLTLIWSGGTPTATYESTGDTFTVDISDDCTIVDVDGIDVTGSTSFTATFTMDFATLDITIFWDEA
jgi:hypothetical protein